MVKFQLSGLYSSEEMGVGVTESSDIIIDIEAYQNNTQENKKKLISRKTFHNQTLQLLAKMKDKFCYLWDSK